MAGLDDLITFLAIDQAKQKAIAESDPYAGGSAIADQIGTAIASSGPQFSTRDKMIGGLLTGLIGGGLQGASKDYQSRASTAYQDTVLGSLTGQLQERPSVLSSGLFGQAKQQGNLFKIGSALQAAQGQRDLSNEIKKQTILADIQGEKEIKTALAKEVMSNPRNAAKIMQGYSTLFGGGKAAAVPAATPAIAPTAPGVDADESGLNLILGGGITDAAAAPMVDASIAAAPKAVDPAMAKALGILGPSFQVPESIENKQLRIAQRFMDEGNASPSAAWDSAAKQIEADRLALKASATKAVAVRDSANKAIQLADTAEQGMMGAGETGGMLNAPRNLASLAFSAISPEETAQRASQGLLDTVRPEIVQTLRSPGAVSDFETKMMIGAGPSSSNTPEQNRVIIDKMRGIGKLNLEYADFLDWYRDKVGTMTGAEKVWGAYKAENPLILQDQTGQGQFNQNRPSIFDWLNDAKPVSPEAVAKAQKPEQPPTPPSSAAAVPATDNALQKIGQVAGSFVQGVGETLQAIGAMVKPETYKEAFKDPVTGLETVGRGAAMLAGATTGGATGAALGGPIAPLTALIGAGIGAGAGYLGYNSAEEAASELAGVGTDKSVVPTMADVNEAARVGGQGAGLGAVAKGVGVAGRGVRGAVRAADDLAGEAVGSAKSELLGVKPKDLRKSVKDGNAKYYDESGTEVPVKDATTYQSKVEQAIDTVDQDGVFSAAKNDPKAMRVEFDKNAKVAAQDISQLHNSTDAALKELHSKLSPIQQKQFPLTRDPKTGKGGFLANKEDFRPVYDQIRQIAETQPQMAKALKARADAIIEKWNKGSRSYNAMQDKKALFGKDSFGKKQGAPITDAWTKVQAQFNRVFADAQGRAFDYAAQATDPSKVGALTAANAKFSAYKTLEPMMRAKAATGKPSFKVGTLGGKVPSSLFNRSPATALKGAETIKKVTGATSRVMGGERGAVSKGLLGAVGKDIYDAANAVAPAIPGAIGGVDEINAAYQQLRQPSAQAAPIPTVTPEPTATPIKYLQNASTTAQPMMQARRFDVPNENSDLVIDPRLPDVNIDQEYAAIRQPKLLTEEIGTPMKINPIVSEFEGGQRLKAYPPPDTGSGVTVATGIDLGGRSAKELTDLGLSEPLVKKLTPYLGKKDALAKTLLKEKPLSLNKAEADELDEVIGGSIGSAVNEKYAAATGGDIAELPEEAQNVIASLAHNFGPNLDTKLPSLWKTIVANDWAGLQDKLLTTDWTQKKLVPRRKKEAEMLTPIIEVA